MKTYIPVTWIQVNAQITANNREANWTYWKGDINELLKGMEKYFKVWI